LARRVDGWFDVHHRRHFEPPDTASDLDPNEDAPCFTGTATFPTPNLISSPVSLSKSGAVTGTYPVARFETDLPWIEEANNGGGLSCDHHTGASCTSRHKVRPSPPGSTCCW